MDPWTLQYWLRTGKLRRLQRRLSVWDLLQSVSALKRGGSCLALQEGLAGWAPHYAESAPQPPGFAGVTCLQSTVLDAQHCGRSLGEALVHRLPLHFWEPQFTHLQGWAHCLLY